MQKVLKVSKIINKNKIIYYINVFIKKNKINIT